jgi:hypothetical protein
MSKDSKKDIKIKVAGEEVDSSKGVIKGVKDAWNKLVSPDSVGLNPAVKNSKKREVKNSRVEPTNSQKAVTSFQRRQAEKRRANENKQ